MMRSRSHTSSDACSSRSKLFLPDHHDAITKDVAAGCAVTIDAFSYQSDDEPLRVVPFFEIQSPLEKKRRLGRYIRNAHSSRATASYSQTPSESRSLRLLQWSCLFPREVCFELDQDCLPGDLILFDPTEPLIYGELDGRQDPILVQAAHLFHVLLEEHRYICMARREADDEDLNAAVDETLGCIIALLRECPCVAQVHYPLPSEFWMDKNECYCFPLVHFCVTNCLEGLSACYHAFPEAIGCTVHGWLPLHFAAKHSTYSVVQFLLERFPNAARRTHTRTHKTPLHIACQRHDPNAKSSIIRRIMQQYPTALQLADRHGWVPVHHLCACKSTDVYLLQMVIEASPTTIRATTRHWSYLHIFCRQGSARRIKCIIEMARPIPAKVLRESIRCIICSTRCMLIRCKLMRRIWTKITFSTALRITRVQPLML
ncbi:hypothetical protein MPSEU_000780700 [Mayamaea pseudoterrestris]|nr:hypothetical protein MPSEU_000780700 [Mayamaea pseudoterrestris]